MFRNYIKLISNPTRKKEFRLTNLFWISYIFLIPTFVTDGKSFGLKENSDCNVDKGNA